LKRGIMEIFLICFIPHKENPCFSLSIYPPNLGHA
jgi:hypothetical protein